MGRMITRKSLEIAGTDSKKRLRNSSLEWELLHVGKEHPSAFLLPPSPETVSVLRIQLQLVRHREGGTLTTILINVTTTTGGGDRKVKNSYDGPSSFCTYHLLLEV